MSDPLRIRWCDDSQRIPALVSFFVDHTDPGYISHGELMDGRADELDQWSDALPRILAEEFRECEFGARPTRPTGKRIALAEAPDGLAAFSLVELCGEGRTRHAVIHDLVVDRAQRGAGIGARLLAWLESSLAREGVRRLFLESGLDNEAAHRFFERAGYRKSSVTMMKTLDARDREAPPS